MAKTPKTVIVTGGSQGIGSGVVKAFLDRDYNVVATSRNVTKSKDLPSSPRLALVDGDIGDVTAAARVAETAISTFSSIDALVNNAGIFFTKPFTDYTAEDFKQLSTNLDGFISRLSRCWCKNRVGASSALRPRSQIIRLQA
jgi:NAD(P)-dependent dehydrogenase (short-subunit alcohol dehydrogenase family)